MTKSKTKAEVFEEIAELCARPIRHFIRRCYYTDAIIKKSLLRPVKKFDRVLLPGGANPNTQDTLGRGLRASLR